MSDYDYSYNEQEAARADNAASRLNEQGAYVGKITKAQRRVSAEKGTQGITFEFEVPGSGTAEFTLWTRKGTGEAAFGASFLNAIMYMIGLRDLRGEPGMVEEYDADIGQRVEKEGVVYPGLYGKPVGLVLQQELFSKQNGGEGSRLSLVGVFQPETRLMFTELKERKTQPVKLDRLLKSLKIKDTRTASTQPAQPSLGGVPDGGF